MINPREKSFWTSFAGQIILMTGLMLLAGCELTYVKPIYTCIPNQQLAIVACGLRYFDIRETPSDVGEWVDPENLIILDIDNKDLTNHVCIDPEDWLLHLKPYLKENARIYEDRNNN